jgi:holo-[acyl-carrier protein] synthase
MAIPLHTKIGTDIVTVDRIEKAIEKFGESFLKRFLTSKESALCKDKTESIAGFWAAKEAIAKALGCGIGKELSFLDIVLAKDAKGAPYFTLHKEKKEYFRLKNSSLSISHDGNFAIAVVIIETF